MSSIPQVSAAMQTILDSRAKALERQTGFVQRASVQLDGPVFAQTCVLTWMQRPDASWAQCIAPLHITQEEGEPSKSPP